MITSRRMKWAGHIERMEAKLNANRILVCKPEENRPLGRTKRRGWTILKRILERERMGWYGFD
jgi:hypothetical protein